MFLSESIQVSSTSAYLCIVRKSVIYLQKSNKVNELLLRRMDKDARILLVSSISKGRFFLRFVVCAVQSESSHIKFAWDVISEIATKVLSEVENNTGM